MSRRRWVYTSGGVPLPEPVEVSEDWMPHDAERNGTLFMVDRFMEGDRAQDGTDIGSRAKRRAYMQAHRLADAGDFTEHWKKAEAQRYRADNDKGARVEAIRRALHGRK